MDYLIGNGTQYINCDCNGKYQLCSKGTAKVFSEKAANKFIHNTPKQFKKYHMKIFPIREKSEHEIKQEQILMRATKHAKKAGYITNGNQKRNNENVFDADIWLKS